jgi:hypothetical protein
MAKIIKELTLPTSASRAAIWQLWSDVPNWNKWDSEIEYAKLDGKFELGQTGEMKPKGGPKAKTKIIELTELQSFSDVTNLPLAKLRFDHKMEEQAGQILVTHTISISGPLGFFFAKLLSKNLVNGLEAALPRLIALAEKNDR